MAILIGGCEAPLNLEGIAQERYKKILRFDMYQAAAHHVDSVEVVSSVGDALVSEDNGANWERLELAGRPSLIAVWSGT